MIKCPGCGEENPPKFRLCGYCGAPLAPAAATLPAREVRKTVTILFSDLKGSTALGEVLDPEALHEVKERYFRAMAAEITRHGGKIEKYIGDAIMAVFGLPRAREDDALRAVRAAVGMQRALQEVNADLMPRYGVALANRTGVNTGEVVATDDPTADQKLATGDAVNVAARLEQAAPENQVYLGETTYRLVRDAVEVEAVAPLELKGKAQRVPAFRLIAAPGLDGLVRRHDRPLVGRGEEIAALEAVFREVRDGAAVRTVTLVGDAGFGKSRLVRELIERTAAGAGMLFGRCLPYGDGITFWPLSTMVRDAARIADHDAPEEARRKLLAAVGDRDVAQRLASIAGLATTSFPLGEINWAARKFFEGRAAGGPLIVFVDDIHWAEPGLLDLLEHVQRSSTGAPILVLATARHDLYESRPQWGSEPGSSRIDLRPLSDADAAVMLANLVAPAALAPDVVQRIVVAAAGNSLYAEQMLQMLIDDGALRLEGGCWVRADESVEIATPPTIHALLEARLDRLERAERATIEPASVMGLEFPQPALAALVPEAVHAMLPAHLKALAAKQFIHPKPAPDGQPHYRFHNHLVRETVYHGLLKRARAQLHLEFVRWVDRAHGSTEGGAGLDEILGWHLEQAWRYLGELGPLGEAGVAIGVDAGRRLAAAGRRAAARGDMHAAANLLRRASALLPAPHGDRLPLLPELGEVLLVLGRFDEARGVLAEAVTLAQAAWDERIETSATLAQMFLRLYSGEEGEWAGEALRAAEAAVPVLERLGAHLELARAWRLIAFVHGVAGHYAEANAATVHYMSNARLAGDDRLVSRSAMGFAMGALAGPIPVPEAIEICERSIAGGLSDRQAQSVIQCVIAQLRAMNGEFDEARRLYREGRAMLRELGQGVIAASTAIDAARVELLAGDLEAAEREARADYEFLKKSGETYVLSTLEGLLSRIVRDLGRDDEALAMTQAVEAAAAPDDVEAQVQWRAVRAPILARRGDLAAAEAMAREAVKMSATSDSPVIKAEALAELAALAKCIGEDAEAERCIREAEALYKVKGDVISAARLRGEAAPGTART